MLNFIKRITRFYPKRGDRKSTPLLNIGPIHWLDPNSPFEEKEKKKWFVIHRTQLNKTNPGGVPSFDPKSRHFHY